MNLQSIVLLYEVIKLALELLCYGISLASLADESFFLKQVNLALKLGSDDFDVRLKLFLGTLQADVIVLEHFKAVREHGFVSHSRLSGIAFDLLIDLRVSMVIEMT